MAYGADEKDKEESLTKKIILAALSIILLFSLACGLLFSFFAREKEQLVEKSIDGVAAYLGYFDGEDIDNVSEKMAGAIAGKYFKDGQVYIFQLDPESEEYKYQQTQTDTCVGGFVVMYEIDPDGDMTGFEFMTRINKISDIKFKEEENKE